MRGYSIISDEERAQILNTHRSFYDGYATGNVPSSQTPLTVEDLAQDKNGLQVTNTGEVKQYNNHIHEQVEIDAPDMDISDEEPAYDFISQGPEGGETIEGEDKYRMDIEGIMNMFGGDMSPADLDIVFGDGEERDEFDNYFNDSKEIDLNQDIEDIDFMEEEICEQCEQEMYEEIDEELRESFKQQREKILETFNRFNKFN